MILSAEPIPLRPMRCITVNSPSGLFLAGEGMIPTHNTHLAVAALIEWLARGKAGMYVNVPRFLDELRNTFEENDATAASVMQPLLTWPVIVLDDLGAEKSTEWTMEKIYEVVDMRYSAGLATAVTSNVARETWDPRIVSRLMDKRKTSVVYMRTEDYRLKDAV